MLKGIEQLRQFKIFAELDEEDFESVGRISRVQTYGTAEKLTTEGEEADQLFLFLKGRASVKMLSPEGKQVPIDELGPGEMLGWGAVMEPHVYTASAWTSEPSQVILVDGKRLRELSASNERIGYQVAKGIGEVISRRFGQAVGGRGQKAAATYGVDELRQFKIFSELALGDLESVAQISEIKHYESGEELAKEGAAADRLYLFLKGKADVRALDPKGHQAHIDELGPGELLGWGAVTEPYLYTASAWTTEPSDVIVVDGKSLRELSESNKQIGYQVAKGVGEVMSRRFGMAVGGPTGHAVAEEGIAELHHFKIFAELDEADLEAIARISHVKEFGVAQELTSEGAIADQLYLFLKGKAAVKVRGADGRQVLIDELGPGEMLGWGAVMYPHVYTASAWTTEPSEVIVVDGKSLRGLSESNKQIGYQVAKGIGEVISKRFGQSVAGRGGQALGVYRLDELRQFKLFSELDVADLDAVAQISHVQDFDTGRELTTEGEVADKLYLFVSGRAAVKVREPDGRQVLIDELGPGEVLGWGAVTEPHIYTASAWTTEPSQVIVIEGEDLRELSEASPRIGYQVVKGVGEVISRRFGQAIAEHGVDEFHQFALFEGLDIADLDAIAKISHVQRFETGEQLTSEGAVADRFYLFLSGRVAVKVRGPDGRQILIDELGAGDMLGYGAVTEPHIYSASAWMTEPGDLIVIDGFDLRELCESNKRIGYHVNKGISDVVSRRFGRVKERGGLRPKDMRAFTGEERVVWENDDLQLTTAAVLMGMDGDSPDVIPLEAIQDVEAEGGRVVFHVRDGDVQSPPLEDAERLAALVRGEILRTRYAHRRTDHYSESGRAYDR